MHELHSYSSTNILFSTTIKGGEKLKKNLVLVVLMVFMKVINNLGNEYNGTIGKAVTAATWKGRNYFKKHFTPANPKTERQREVRGFFKSAVTAWQGFTAIEKGAYRWAERYAKKAISAYNTMIGDFVTVRKAGVPYTSPPSDPVQVGEVGTRDPIENAHVIIRKRGQTTIYYEEYTNAEGNCQSSLIVRDQNYDVSITATGYKDYLNEDMTAVQACVQHLIHPI
ncbi:hypothetical protein ES703_46556 [subsurface metagenome]